MAGETRKTRCGTPVGEHVCIGYMCGVCEDADRWATINRLKAERDRLRSTNAALLEALKGLVAVGTGEVGHLYQGLCPDSVEGREVHDPECWACVAINRARAAIEAAGEDGT